MFCGHSAVFSAIWPTAGMTRDGVACPLPPLVLHTPGTARSLLLKTPTSQLAVNGGSQHPDQRKAGGHGPTLADEIEHLLPTPVSRDHKGPGAKSPARPDNGRERTSAEWDLPRVLVALLPTPTAADAKVSGGSNPSNVTLTDAAVRTSFGARTNPRFADGKPSQDDPPLPRQPSLFEEGSG